MVERVVVRYSSGSRLVCIKPVTKQFVPVDVRQVQLPRSERVRQIRDAIRDNPNATYEEIGRAVGLAENYVGIIIRQEKIQRN